MVECASSKSTYDLWEACDEFRLCCCTKGGVNAGLALGFVFPFVGTYVLISRGGGEYACGVGELGLGVEGIGGISVLESRRLVLGIVGGDFMENPDEVLAFILLVLFDLVRPPPGVPSCGAVLGR